MQAEKIIVEQHKSLGQAKDDKVDREKGIIYDVPILASDSKNGNVYPLAVMQEASNLFEGARVYVNHGKKTPDDRGVQPRKVAERLGVIRGVKVTDKGLRADLHYLKTNADADLVAEAAEKNLSDFGMSQASVCRYRRDRRGKRHVSKIVKVVSVDVVDDPGTVSTLSEQTEVDMSVKLKDYVATLEDKNEAKPFLGVIAEQFSDFEMSFESGADDEENLAFVMESVSTHIHDELSPMAAIKLLKEATDATENQEPKSKPEPKKSKKPETKVGGGISEDNMAVLLERFDSLDERTSKLETRQTALQVLQSNNCSGTAEQIEELTVLQEQSAMEEAVSTWSPKKKRPDALKGGKLKSSGGSAKSKSPGSYEEMMQKLGV